MAEILAKNKFRIGDKLEVIAPAGNQEITLDHIEDLQGKEMEEVPGGGYQVRIPLPQADYTQGLLARYLPEGVEIRS
jgi:putative protease